MLSLKCWEEPSKVKAGVINHTVHKGLVFNVTSLRLTGFLDTCNVIGKEKLLGYILSPSFAFLILASRWFGDSFTSNNSRQTGL